MEFQLIFFAIDRTGHSQLYTSHIIFIYRPLLIRMKHHLENNRTVFDPINISDVEF